MNRLLIMLVPYLLGGIPFGLMIGYLARKRDVRQSGSGNIGAANVSRTIGRGAGILTLALDILKGVASVGFAHWLMKGEPFWYGIAGMSALIGHIFPVYLRFRGGKGYAVTIGSFLVLTPLAMLLSVLVFFAVAIPTRIISIGSICSAVALPIIILFFQEYRSDFFSFAVLAAVLIVVRHRSNIRNIIAGTEIKIGGKK